MVIKTKRPIKWEKKDADGKPIKDDKGKPIEASETDLHIFLAFSSNPTRPDGWNLALTLAPGEIDASGDLKAKMELSRAAAYTHDHCPPAVLALANAIQAALQTMVNAQEG